ncbi:MAG: DNA integrity scanning diadenylate cyclase DisA [Kosmotogaceae bacterium]
MVYHDEMFEKIKQVAPGTMIRYGLDLVVDGETGALVFFVDDFDSVKDLVQLGFMIDVEFNPERFYELSKMDGAIVVSEDMSRIIAANVQLVPDQNIETSQTGMRHRTAERMAKQTKNLLIAVSKRRKTITMFLGNNSYALKSLELLLPKVSQLIRTVEQYSMVFDRSLDELDKLEKGNVLMLYDVLETLQKGLMALKISEEADYTIIELGDYGNVPKMQLSEIVSGIKESLQYLILDFNKELIQSDKASEILEKMLSLSQKEISNLVTLGRTLDYELSSASQAVEVHVKSRCIRFIKKIPKIPMQVAVNIGAKFGSLSRLFNSSEDELKEVEGVGEKRATSIKHSIDVHLRQRENE